MASVSIYLNFSRETEEAFGFYKKVFGTEYIGEISRFRDMPPQEGQPPLADDAGNLVMHLSLPILGGTILHGSDVIESAGYSIKQGNNVSIMLEPDTRGETDTLFSALSEGGTVDMPLEDAFWGDYFGSLRDRYGIQWMLVCSAKD